MLFTHQQIQNGDVKTLCFTSQPQHTLPEMSEAIMSLNRYRNLLIIALGLIGHLNMLGEKMTLSLPILPC